jgi:hypothetical protein
MALRLHESWSEALRQVPETGMGYQVLELRGLSARVEHVIVANGSEALDIGRGYLAVREGVEKGAEDRVAKALQGPVGQVGYRVLSRPEAILAKVLESRKTSGTGPAVDGDVEVARPREEFLRFSAFSNDVRILADGSVTPGTYVTTHGDGMEHVHTGMDAVKRYALPNPAPAVHRYYLKPWIPIAIQRGTVQPDHGQPGGGAEVIFVAGAPPATKCNQDQIPPK